MAEDSGDHVGLKIAAKKQKTVNPFFNLTAHSKQTRLRRIMLALAGAVLLPLRVVLSLILIAVAFALAKLATLGLTDADLDPLSGPPLAAWRQAVVAPFGVLSRIQMFLLGFWWVTIKGKCASREEAPIIVSNHVSGLVEGMYFVVHSKLAEKKFVSNPLLGAVMKATCSIFVDRSDPNSRDVALRALLRRATADGFRQTVVFPEGCCTNGAAVVQFRVGAFAPGVPVQPVCFRYPDKDFDASFTAPLTAGTYLLGLLLRPVARMEVEYLPVYRPSEAERRDPALFAAAVQQRIAEALGVPAAQYAAEDSVLCNEAMRVGLPFDAGLVSWQALSQQLPGLRVREAIAALRRFRSLDVEGRGRVDLEAFAAGVRGAGADAGGFDDELRGVFRLLDGDQDGFVDFREYLWGVSVLKGRPDQNDATASLRMMFDGLSCGRSSMSRERLGLVLSRSVPDPSGHDIEWLCTEADADGDGQISRDEFVQFAAKHRDDLGMTAEKLLLGLPMPERVPVEPCASPRSSSC